MMTIDMFLASVGYSFATYIRPWCGAIHQERLRKVYKTIRMMILRYLLMSLEIIYLKNHETVTTKGIERDYQNWAGVDNSGTKFW